LSLKKILSPFLFISFASANSLLENGLATVHALNIPGFFELDSYYFKTQQYEYRGKVVAEYVEDVSYPKTSDHIGIFVVSDPINSLRFALSIAPDLRDEAYMNWNDSHITAMTDTGFVKYRIIKPQISYAFSPILFGSFGINIVEGKAGRTLSATSPLPYSLSMQGDGRARSFSGELAYRPYEWLLMSFSGTTEALVDFHGNVDAHLGGTTIPSKVNMKMSVPAEYLVNAMLFLDETTYINFSYRKWLYSTYETSNLQIDDPTLESYFGAPSKRAWSDSHVYTLGGGKRFDNHSINLFAGWNKGGINLSTSDFSSPPSKFRFMGGEYSYDLSKEWSIGGRYVYVRYSKEKVSTPILEGEFLQTSSIISSIYLQKRF
jgi:hypothetical protein